MTQKPQVTIPVQQPVAVPLLQVEVTLSDSTTETFERVKDFRILSNGVLYVGMEDGSSRAFNTPEWAEATSSPVKQETEQPAAEPV